MANALLERTAAPDSARPARRPLRLCHVLSSFQIGGAERFALRLAHAQREAGHDVTVLALQDGPLAAQAADLRVPFHVCKATGRWRIAAECLSFFRSGRFDLVNSHNPSAHRVAVMAKLWRVPAVMTLHGEVSRCYGQWVCRGRCDGVIAVSAQARQSFIEKHRGLPAADIQVIENGILLAKETGGSPEIRAALGIGDETVLTTVARLVALKDIGTLLRAFQRCSPRERNLLLLVVGDGECRQELESLAGELGIAPWVRFMGFRSDINAIQSASDLFVLSSLTEGMPLSVLEAMAAGLPVVATRVGGVPELVADPETGRLVSPKDPEGLAAALITLVDDRPLRLRMGRAARARIEGSFSFNAMLDQYDAFYRRVLAVRGRLLCVSQGGGAG